MHTDKRPNTSEGAGIAVSAAAEGTGIIGQQQELAVSPDNQIRLLAGPGAGY